MLPPRFLGAARPTEEFFMTGTGSEVMPVGVIDGKRIGAAAPGPVTRRLKQAFDELVRKEIGST